MKTKLAIVIACGVLLSSVIWAQTRTSRGNSTTRPAGMSEADYTDCKQFIYEHMRNLHALAFTEGPKQRKYAPIAWNHYKSYLNARNVTSNGIIVRNNLLTSYTAEDKVYGLIIEYYDTLPENQPGMRDAIRAEVRNVVEKNFSDREERIERLKRDLAAEADRLAMDRRNVEQIVSRRMNNQFISDSPATSPATTRPFNNQANQSPGGTLAAPMP